MSSDHILDCLNAATKLFESSERELWRPDRSEQMAAVEVLLASSIPAELRRLLRERELALATKRDAA